MSVARKKRINEQCQQQTLLEAEIKKKEKKRGISESSVEGDGKINVVSRNWATAGFFEVNATFDTIRTEEPEPSTLRIEKKAKPRKLLDRRVTRQLSTGEFVYDDIEVGDVFEEVRKKRVKHGPLHLFKVLQVFPQTKAAIVESSFGKEKKKWRELLDDTNYRLILTDMNKKGSRVPFRPQNSVRDPLLQEKAKYSGEEGKIGLFTLFRYAPAETPPVLPPVTKPRESENQSESAPQLPTHATLAPNAQERSTGSTEHRRAGEAVQTDSAAPVSQQPVITPRLAYIQACRKDALPPIPLLSRCFDEAYPVLDLSDQSVGSRFCAALADAIPNMKFLRELNLTGNRLDHRSAVVIISCLATASIESLILDNNKIGKQGITALLSLMKGSGGNSSASPLPLPPPPSSSSSSGGTSQAVPSRLPPLQMSGFPVVLSSSDLATPFKLVNLSLNDNDLGDTLVSKLVKCLATSCGESLTHLGLSKNRCALFTAKALSKFLGDSVCSLQYLDLGWNDLQTKGGTLLLKVLLSSNKTVQDVNLDWNGIGEEVVPLLVGLCASEQTAMRRMSIEHNHLSDRLLKEIEKKSPSQKLKFNEKPLSNVLGL